MKYVPPLGSSTPDAPYTDPVDGIIPAAAIEQPMREIANVIASMGIVPSDTDCTQLDQAIDLKVAAMQPDVSAFVGVDRVIATAAPLTGGGSLATDLALGLNAASAATPEHVVLRDGSGRAQVAAPREDADIAVKSYVDAAVNGGKSYTDSAIVEALRGAGRIRRDSDVTLYVRTDGHDANDGLEDTPERALATFQGARGLMRRLDMAGNVLTVSFGPGAHTAPVTLEAGDACGASQIIVKSTDAGDMAFLDCESNACATYRTPSRVVFCDLRLRSAREACIAAIFSWVTLRGRIICEGGKRAVLAGIHSQVALEGDAVLYLRGGYEVGIYLNRHGFFAHEGQAIVYESPHFGTAGLYAGLLSAGWIAGGISGTATGPKFKVECCGLIHTGGRGIDLLPGSEAGVIEGSSGGHYF